MQGKSYDTITNHKATFNLPGGIEVQGFGTIIISAAIHLILLGITIVLFPVAWLGLFVLIMLSYLFSVAVLTRKDEDEQTSVLTLFYLKRIKNYREVVANNETYILKSEVIYEDYKEVK